MDRWRYHRFSWSAFDGLALIEEGDDNRLSQWGRWTSARLGLPLSAFPIKLTSATSNTAKLALPAYKPPETEAQEAEALAYFTDLLEVEGACLVAQ